VANLTAPAVAVNAICAYRDADRILTQQPHRALLLTHMSKTALLRACKTVGSQQALANAIGLRSQGTIAGWLRRERVPAGRVLDIERVSGVSRHDLRPDIYPIEPALRRAKATRTVAQ
jgi:DNA-binding transcriptional regulator YdaS (Cro superfamily)